MENKGLVCERPPSYHAVISGINVDESSADATLDECVYTFRTQLGLNPDRFPTMASVVDEACRQLGIKNNGSILDRAHECMSALVGVSPLAQVVDAQPPSSPAVRNNTSEILEPSSSAEPFPSYISAYDLEGPYMCCCFPFPFCATFAKDAMTDNKLKHSGCCYLGLWPCGPVDENRLRVPRTNNFKKDGEEGNIDRNFICCGTGCTHNCWSCSRKMPGFSSNNRDFIDTSDIDGYWSCCCFPFCALFKKSAEGPNTLHHRGVCCFLCVPLMPFDEHRDRKSGTNHFEKRGEKQNLDKFSSSSRSWNGASVSYKLC